MFKKCKLNFVFTNTILIVVNNSGHTICKHNRKELEEWSFFDDIIIAISLLFWCNVLKSISKGTK